MKSVVESLAERVLKRVVDWLVVRLDESQARQKVNVPARLRAWAGTDRLVRARAARRLASAVGESLLPRVEVSRHVPVCSDVPWRLSLDGTRPETPGRFRSCPYPVSPRVTAVSDVCRTTGAESGVQHRAHFPALSRGLLQVEALGDCRTECEGGLPDAASGAATKPRVTADERRWTQRAQDAQVKSQKAKVKAQNAPRRPAAPTPVGNLATSRQRRRSVTTSRKRRCCTLVWHRDSAGELQTLTQNDNPDPEGLD